MKFNRVQNLLGFYMNINNVIKGQSLLECSPDYIEEKWKYWIGVFPTKKHLHGSTILTLGVYDDIELKWCNKWKIDDNSKKYKDLREIILFIIHYSYFKQIEITKLISLYKEYIGDPELISDDPLNFSGLHDFLKQVCNDVIYHKINKSFIREIQLNELLT